MSNEAKDLSIPLQVCLGEIELSLGELLKMEKGESLSCDFGCSEGVTLLLAGEPVARASVVDEGDRIKIHIEEVSLKQKSETSDTQI